jgi:hypothetical protein
MRPVQVVVFMRSVHLSRKSRHLLFHMRSPLCAQDHAKGEQLSIVLLRTRKENESARGIGQGHLSAEPGTEEARPSRAVAHGAVGSRADSERALNANRSVRPKLSQIDPRCSTPLRGSEVFVRRTRALPHHRCVKGDDACRAFGKDRYEWFRRTVRLQDLISVAKDVIEESLVPDPFPDETLSHPPASSRLSKIYSDLGLDSESSSRSGFSQALRPTGLPPDARSILMNIGGSNLSFVQGSQRRTPALFGREPELLFRRHGIWFRSE